MVSLVWPPASLGMHYFIFDAAGDPGLQVGKADSAGGSKPFYVSCVISTSDKDAITDRLATLRQTFGLASGYEFKFHALDHKYREPFFTEFAKPDIHFKAYVSVWIKDSSLRSFSLSKLKGNARIGRLLAELLGEAVASTSPPINRLHCIIDQKKNDHAVANAIRLEISTELRSRGIICTTNVSPRESHTEKSLQLADMIAGMIVHRYKNNTAVLSRIIKGKLDVIKV